MAVGHKRKKTLGCCCWMEEKTFFYRWKSLSPTSFLIIFTADNCLSSIKTGPCCCCCCCLPRDFSLFFRYGWTRCGGHAIRHSVSLSLNSWAHSRSTLSNPNQRKTPEPIYYISKVIWTIFFLIIIIIIRVCVYISKRPWSCWILYSARHIDLNMINF